MASFGCLCQICENLLLQGEVEELVDRTLIVERAADSWEQDVEASGVRAFVAAAGPSQRLT